MRRHASHVNVIVWRIALGLAVTCSVAAASEEAAERPQRPKLQFLRFNEDWSVLRDLSEAERSDPWDPLKYIPLEEGGESWLSLGGHLRERLESWHDFDFGAGETNDDMFLLTRLALHTDWHFGERLRVFIEGKSALATDRDLRGGRRPIDVDTLDLEQAFVDLALGGPGNSQFTLRAGRQVFSFGAERLVCPLAWSNTVRRWDGASLLASAGEWTLHGFASQYVPIDKHDFNDPDEDDVLFGLYTTWNRAPSGPALDLYYFGLDRTEATFNGSSGQETRHTVGTRLEGRLASDAIDYDAEVAYQFGAVGHDEVRAHMAGIDVGYSFLDWWGTPRLHAGYELGSGDGSAGGDVETFNQLFPLCHLYYGYADLIGRQNNEDLSLGVGIKPVRSVAADVTAHWFERNDIDDALYDEGGIPLRPGDASDAREIGQEIDFTITYAFDRHLSTLLGYSRFFAGDFIEESGPHDDVDFVYLQLEYMF
ncbi:MAG: alginate export family protein [Planctomycetota bacterium]